MAWRRFHMAKAAGTLSAPIPSNCNVRWAGVLNHPNVAAAIILGLGCEVNQIDHYLGAEVPRAPIGWWE